MKAHLLIILILNHLVSCNSSYLDPTSDLDVDPPTIEDYGSGNAGLNHGKLANKFIENISQETGYNYSLLKTKTKRYNFIVALNPETDDIFAINISTYNPNNSATDYLEKSAALVGFEFLPQGYYTEFITEIVGYDQNNFPIYETIANEKYRIGNEYKHIETGLIFEKTESTPKDLAKVAAISEALELEKQGKLLSENFGLSLTRANEVARLTRHWQKASQKGMTKKEIDTFSKELLGFTFSTGHKALKRAINGDPSELDQLIEKASFHNDITPEHSVKLFNKILK